MLKTIKMYVINCIFALILSASVSCSLKGDEPFLAHDAKTGEYIGVVVSECRDFKTKKITGYKIETKDGKVIERTADSVSINPP